MWHPLAMVVKIVMSHSNSLAPVSSLSDSSACRVEETAWDDQLGRVCAFPSPRAHL